ncbi:uncharacterized protein LOC121729675 isoform X1 [Aricia agestis]|uniref:uncharacterized protein LOC121729675 isoform X1 n=1 Tax=Aricia agestis TaxID=91739 RepID=UPI001C20316D|nr:uncharacterized protein LOC121729675 isoform X1 [Aricia agestis]
MRQSLLPLLLLTTITLSLSDVLPLTPVDQTEEPVDGDQEYDNTFNTVDNDRNIFYELFKGTDSDKSKSRRKHKTYPVKIFNDATQSENYDDKGYRKEQWHNYPRQLDRLHRSSYEYPEIETANDFDYSEKNKGDDPIISEDILGTDIDEVAGPLLILKIRLAFLTNNMKNIKSNKNYNTDSVELDSSALSKFYKDDDQKLTNRLDSIENTKREGAIKLKKKNQTITDTNPQERKSVNKRIFSLWSRLQSLSHKGHELHHRRHLYSFYGLPEGGGGALTAETRASLVRPPGSPLRWG